MKPLFLSSLIVFCLLIAYENRKHKKMEDSFQKNFWAREAKANSTRKKSLDELPYITIPFDDLPMDTLADDTDVSGCHTLLHTLATQKIVNLTGLTNTELKLRYGAANITCLSEYDENYTLLARTLQKWAESLYQAGFEADAQSVLEFAVSTGTDISSSYFLLADIYDRQGYPAKKEALIPAASRCSSLMKNIIVRTLQESGPYSGLPHSS